MLPHVLPDQLRVAAALAYGILYPSEKELLRTRDLIISAAKEFDGEPIQPGDWLYDGVSQLFRVAASNLTADPMIAEVQTGTAPDHGYYLFGGSASYSGGLAYPVTVQVVDVPIQVKMTWFWLFWCGRGGAGCGVEFKIPARIFTVKLLKGNWAIREPHTFKSAYDAPVACWRH